MDSRRTDIFGQSGNGAPQLKRYLEEVQQGTVPITYWNYDEVGHNDEAKKELKNLFIEPPFDTPKPTRLLKQILNLAMNKDNNDIVLDFFSGSATIADALMQLNTEDFGNRKYVLVQLDESVKENSVASQSGYQTIDQIGRKRIELAAAKIRQDYPAADIDYGFKHYRLRALPENVLEKMEAFDPQALFQEEGIRSVFDDPTILATWANQDGYGLTAKPIEVDLGGYNAYWMKDHVYLIDPKLNIEHLKKLIEKYHEKSGFGPTKVVVFGYGIDMRTLSSLRESLKQLQYAGKEHKVELQIRE